MSDRSRFYEMGKGVGRIEEMERNRRALINRIGGRTSSMTETDRLANESEFLYRQMQAGIFPPSYA